jgi:hypothetical protein
MPVRKFRSITEMPSPPPRPPLDPDNLRIALELSAFAARLCPRQFPTGVHKYRSIEEASRRREAWEEEGSLTSGD